MSGKNETLENNTHESDSWIPDPSYRSRRSIIFGLRGLQLLIIMGAFVLTAGGAFFAGYMVARSSDDPSMNIFREAFAYTESFYYPKPSASERVYGAIQGMLATLKDQYSIFMPPAAAAVDNSRMQGEEGGIGASVGLNKNKEVVVIDAKIGWPAAQAGIKAGDIILSADGQSLTGLPIDQAVGKVRGLLGTDVKLSIKRANVDQPLEFTVNRQQINVYGTMLDNKIAYISLSIFNRKAGDEVHAQLEQLLPQKPQALIFDLRDNPGGYVDQAIAVAEQFLPDGVIATEKSSDGTVQTFYAHSGDPGEKIPLFVLVNGNSASASEIVSGALQDRKRAILVGQQTYGKGSVQAVHELSDHSQLRITVGAWYTPNQTPIQKDGKHIGLTPDLIVTLPDNPADALPKSDLVRDAAVQYILSHSSSLSSLGLSVPVSLPTPTSPVF